jgi:hypothetical protein
MRKSDEQIKKELSHLGRHYQLQENLASYFTRKYSYCILPENIFEALFIRLTDKKNLEWPGDLWDIDISYEDALQLLSDYDFKTIHNNINTSTKILPKELLMDYKVLIKSKGLVWKIHKYDKDPFPSNPHAHQLTCNIKLDLSNGKCYKIRKHLYTISKKDLLDIREKAKKVVDGDLPILEI